VFIFLFARGASGVLLECFVTVLWFVVLRWTMFVFGFLLLGEDCVIHCFVLLLFVCGVLL